MILLKANEDLKGIFQKIVKTMGGNVTWLEIFIISNNELILLGQGRSWFFQFDSKRAFSNFIDIDVNSAELDTIQDNELLENTLNMTLYTFGKWGQIKGLKVEKDYEQLNRLLNYILEEIKIEAVLTPEQLRFFQEGIQVTYEDVIQKILEKEIPEEEGEQKEEEINEGEASEDSLGLWHKVLWHTRQETFSKEELTEEEQKKSRLGNDFYRVNYKCPSCSEKLYMIVYPRGKEFRIETDEGGVYLARGYTCKNCYSFYTPKPDKLLVERDVFYLNFEEDQSAYEDYLELMGTKGEKTSNSNFNQYEADYLKKQAENNQEDITGIEELTDIENLEELYEQMDDMSDEKLEELQEKIEAGFFRDEQIEELKQKSKQELVARGKWMPSVNRGNTNKQEVLRNEEGLEQEAESLQEEVYQQEVTSKQEGLPKYGLATEQAELSKQGQARMQEGVSQQEVTYKQEIASKEENSKQENASWVSATTVEILHPEKENSFEEKAILNPLYQKDKEAFGRGLEQLLPTQLLKVKEWIYADTSMEEAWKTEGVQIVDRFLYKDNEKRALEKAVSCKGKSYNDITSAIQDIEREELAENVKTSILSSLKQLLEKTGRLELERILSQVPDNVSKNQFKLYKEKIEAYGSIASEPYIKRLEEVRDQVEKKEIEVYIKKINPRDRQSNLNLYHRLKEEQFEERNTAPFLEKIYEKVQGMDEASIRRICPEPADVSFEDGLVAYEQILLGEYLPELKEDTLSALDKRLTKIKMDECEQLVHKLSKELGGLIKPENRIFFNNVRKMWRGNLEDEESILINNAQKTFALNNGKYEFPVLLCDTSYSKNGERGFLLTANHIFYNHILGNGKIDVMDIDGIEAGGGLFQKGIYVIKSNHEKVRISNSLKAKNLKTIAKGLHEFIGYLKEKPESRNIAYLAKEKHEVKICYRCGYRYKEGVICPKCGSKYNG